MLPTFKVPLRLAPGLGVSKSLVQRWNKGTRKITDAMAMKIVDLLEEEGKKISILALKPELKALVPYLCRSHAKQRKLCEGPPKKAGCPVA